MSEAEGRLYQAMGRRIRRRGIYFPESIKGKKKKWRLSHNGPYWPLRGYVISPISLNWRGGGKKRGGRGQAF